MRLVLLFLPAAVFLSGCYASSPMPSYAAMKESAYLRMENQETIRESLFPEDQKLLSNEAIQTLLAGKIELPGRARIALVRLDNPQSRYWWSPETARQDQRNTAELLNKLKQSRRIGAAMLMPSVLIGKTPSLSALRAAAARCQADLLLIYTGAHEYYTKSKLFSGEEANAYCAVEALLLDVRTGIVPFTAEKMEDYAVKESRQDINFAETLRKAQLAALDRALTEIAGELVQFLDRAP